MHNSTTASPQHQQCGRGPFFYSQENHMNLEFLIALGCVALIIHIVATVITTVIGLVAIWKS